MKVIQSVLILLVCVALLLSGCAGLGGSAETSLPTEESTVPTTPPTDDPTKPVEVNSEWLNAPLQHLSYQDFFAQERTLTKLINSRWELGESERFYVVYHDAYGLYIKPSGRDTSRDGRLHHVPNSEWIQESAFTSYMPADGRYLYCIRNEKEIVRVELLTGEVEVLYSGGEIVGGFAVYKEGVMYFAAREKESTVLYRLYIPERKLDVLYNQIPEDIPYGPWFSLMAPETNWSAIGWKMMNPEMYRYVDAELKNPNSSYAGEDWWTEKFRDWSKHDDIAVSVFIEGILTDFGVKYEIPYRLVCSYDYRNAVYSQREEFAEPPKVTEKHPFTLEGTHLTRKELDWFQNVFFTYTDTDASGKATFNIRNMFLRAEFKKPEEINLGLVFSMGVTRHSEVSQKEKDLYDQATNNDMKLDYFKTPRKDMEQLFYENTGITVDQSQKVGLDKLVYLKEYDAYYTKRGDTAYTSWSMREGVRMEDGTIVLLYSEKLGKDNPICKVTLAPRGDSYIIVANDRQGKS